MKLERFYIVVTQFHNLGFGSANDATKSRDQAYDNWAGAVSDGQPARAFQLDFDTETDAFETAREISSDFADEYCDIVRERGLEDEG